jgi:cellulose synthase/poly-beta-1,6-N-acetylglucosamine synthase-like glycosyltransferase
VVSATGAILAMRPALWRELPTGLICDDLYTGLSVVRQNSRVGFCSDAVAYDPRVFSREQQFTRRVRTLTGLIQYCVVEPGRAVSVE